MCMEMLTKEEFTKEESRRVYKYDGERLSG